MAGHVNNYGERGIIDFAKLWDLMKRKGKNKQYLLDNGMSKGTIYNLVRNNDVTCGTIANLCYLLDCKPHQIMEYVKPE